MRDIDREIGIGSFRRDAPADDTGAVERNRRIGEMLLLADEVEETLHALRAAPDAEPIEPGRPREETLRALERRARLERDRVHALERSSRIDYGAVARAMPLSDAMG
ncbi:MAG TPA: hypothetical protein VHG51_08375 [Longimicrobiaceae bacterium]|nr:hypothetical protein [Longimicrobiaceae bacterium]